MNSYVWPLECQRKAWAFEPLHDSHDWVLHVRGDESWEDVVEIIHTWEPSLVVVPTCPTPQETAIGARHMRQMIEEADVGFIQVVVPIVGATRGEQREFFKWADGIPRYLAAPTEASLNNVKVDFRPNGHYAALAPEAFTTNNFVGTWELIINEQVSSRSSNP